MTKSVVTQLTGYGGLTASPAHCPDCGAPLLTVYAESRRNGLQLVVGCAADCGYSRKLARSRPRLPCYWQRDAERDALARTRERRILADEAVSVLAADELLDAVAERVIAARAPRGSDLASHIRIEERELGAGELH